MNDILTLQAALLEELPDLSAELDAPDDPA